MNLRNYAILCLIAEDVSLPSGVTYKHSSSETQQALAELKRLGLVEQGSDNGSALASDHKISDKGQVLLTYLQALPAPTARTAWAMP